MVGRGIEGRIGDRVEQQLEPDVRFPALPGEPRDHRGHVAPDAVASHSQALCVQAMFPPAPGDPPRHHVALLEGCRVAGLRTEPVHREHDGGPGSDGEFAHQPVMRLRAAEYPPGTVDVHDDRQRSLRVLGPQDAKSNLRAGTVCNGELLNVDQGLAHMASLHLIKGGPSLFGTKGEQPGWLRRSLCERLRLGFKLNPVGHWSRSSITNDNSRREPGKMDSIHLTPPRSDSTAGTRPYVCGRVLADCSPPPALHLSERIDSAL